VNVETDAIADRDGNVCDAVGEFLLPLVDQPGAFEVEHKLLPGTAERGVVGFASEVVDGAASDGWSARHLGDTVGSLCARFRRLFESRQNVRHRWDVRGTCDVLLDGTRERRVAGKALGSDLVQQRLIVAERFVPEDVGVAEFDKYRADVLVLSFDRAVGPLAQLSAERSAVGRFVIFLAAQLGAEHVQVVGHDGFDFEANAGWGIDLRGAGGERPASGCRFSSTWDEANLGGSVLFEAGSRYNVVDFLRYSSGSPNDGGLGNVVWGVDARGDSPALVHQFAGFGLNRYVDRMSGSNVALDFGVGSFLELTLTGNVTGGTTFAHVKDGQIIVLALLQDAAGNRTFTWPTNVHCSGGCPALSAAPHARDVFTFYFDGSSFWEVARSVDLL